MIIGAPKESFSGETRVAMTPESAVQLQKLGHECLIQSGAGLLSGFNDKAYKDVGVKVVKTAPCFGKLQT
jgi:NAD(P) transhydrogenase subunit alpha